MKDPNQILTQMEEILKELIHTAEKLKLISQNVISEEEILPLQQRQQELLIELERIDSEYQKATRKKVTPAKFQINQMLDYFEKLNEAFIENIEKRSGLIQFEVSEGKKKKEPKK